jgi:hypothetical protein
MKRKELPFTFEPGTAFTVDCEPTDRNLGCLAVDQTRAKTSAARALRGYTAAAWWESLDVQKALFSSAGSGNSSDHF